MVDGVTLSMLAGPVLPVPVPAVVIDSLISARVNIVTTEERKKDEPPVPARSGFQLDFAMGKNSPLESIFLLTSGLSGPPMIRVVLTVQINGAVEVICDGFIQKQTITPASGGNPAVLTLYGKDITAAMDLQDLSGLPWAATPIFARVASILAKYAPIGVIPIVIPPVLSDVPDPTETIPPQQGTDYAYLQDMARKCGYVFYANPGPAPGTSTCYWGPEIKVGVPQPALNLDMNAHTNVETLTFEFDNEKNVTPFAWVSPDELPFPIPVPIPDVSLINPPLGLVPGRSFRAEPLPDTSKLNIAEAMLFGLSRKSTASEAVMGNGTLNVSRYGRLLKARQLVGVRGAGLAFDGLYYVNSVTHEIKRGSYSQSFKLSRNGIVSTVPRVPV